MTSDLVSVGGVDVSRETIERLEALGELISKWTRSINLIAKGSLPDLWSRHIEDSAQIFSHAPKGWKSWTDIGSGGGLPALVISIIDVERRPLTLIESDQRKCLFLNTARRELDLNITVLAGRIESQNIAPADVLSARALAPLNELLGLANGLVKPDGTSLFPKGEKYKEELDRAKIDWHFDVNTHPSTTHSNARVLEISRIQRREC